MSDDDANVASTEGSESSESARPARRETDITVLDDAVRPARLALEQPNDQGNAFRFARVCGDRVRYAKRIDGWYVWDGCRWAAATTADLLKEARAVLPDLAQHAFTLQDDEERRRWHKWAASSCGKERIKAMLDLARGVEELWIDETQFDADPYLVNFTNCTVDIRTLQWHLHRREDFITKLVPYAYDPAADCPRYREMIARTLACQSDLCVFMHKVLGYAALVGANFEKVIFFLIGPSDSGKTKIVEIAKTVVGADYTHKAKPDLISRKREHHDSERVSIVGKRFVLISETSSMFNLDEQAVKELTGDKEVTTRRLYKGTEELKPVTWKIMLVVNDFPNVLEWDDAIKNRVVPIPAGTPIPPSEQVKDIAERVVATEAAGVCNFLVQGAHRWYIDWRDSCRFVDRPNTGLQPPLDVEQFKEAYVEAMDHVGRFIAECVVVEAGASVRGAAVHEEFKKWRGRGETSNRNRLYARLRALDGVTHDVKASTFYGCRLRTPRWSDLVTRATQ